MNNILMNLITPQATSNVQPSTKDFTENKRIDEVSFKDVIEDKKHDSGDKENITCEKDEYKTKEENHKKYLLKKSSSIVESGRENNLTDDEKIEAVQAQIMQLLATHLNIPLNTLESAMNELGIVAIELLDQNTFMSLMGNIIGEEQLNLLGDSKMLREISELWEAIEHLGQEMVQNGVLTEEQLDWEQISQYLEGTSEKSKLSEEGSTMTLNGQMIQSAEDGLTLNVHKTAKEDAILPNNQQMMEESVKVGLSLPVQNVLESQTVKMWQQTTKEATGLMHTEHAPINKQILEKVNFISLQDGNELTIELDPKELGKLSMKVSEHNGIVTTVIRVDNERAKEMILQNIESLKQGLEEQGLAVGSFQVDVGQNTHHKQMEQQKQKASKRIQEIIDKQMEALEAELVQEEIAISTSREVDIKA